MSVHAAPGETIERFAVLVAQLDDGFADRAAVLGEAGLDEAAWKRLETRWTTQLMQGSEGELVRRFAEAYAAKRHRNAANLRAGSPVARDLRFLNSEAQPWRAAAAVPLDASGVAPPLLSFGDEDTEDSLRLAPTPHMLTVHLDQTAELAFCPPGPVLPFAASRGVEESRVRAAPAAPAPVHRSAVRALDATDSTADISMVAARAVALPFDSARRPLRRFHRFDSRTGQPLSTPHWVDDVDPNKSA